MMQRGSSARPLLLALAFCVVASLAASAQDRLAIKAKRIHTGEGVVENGVLLVVDGKVQSVSAGSKIPSGFRVIDRSDSEIMPGMVDLYSLSGASSDLSESVDAIDAGAAVASAVDTRHRDFKLLRHSGVTSVVALPGHGNVVGGVGCVMKSNGRRAADDRPVKLSLGSEAYANRNRPPTSFVGVVGILLDELKEAGGSSSQAPFARFARGESKGVAWVKGDREVMRGLEMAKAHGLQLSFLGAASIRAAVKPLGAASADVGLEVLTLRSNKRARNMPKLLSEAGASVAFYGRSGIESPENLRMSAALAARAGLAPERALAAITSVPARMAGMEGIGRLIAGADADFLVLAGHPLDLSAPILEVWIDGSRAHRKERR